jgi:Protein of unknown function (DUF3592)
MFFKGPTRKYIAGILIGGGMICAMVALGSFLVGWRFVRTAARADGRIIQMLERKGEDGLVYAPVFSFRDAQGTEYKVYSSTASYPPEHEVGDAVRVLYSPQSPREAKIDRFFSLWALPFTTGVIVALYVPVGLLICFWPRFVQRFRHVPTLANAA